MPDVRPAARRRRPRRAGRARGGARGGAPPRRPGSTPPRPGSAASGGPPPRCPSGPAPYATAGSPSWPTADGPPCVDLAARRRRGRGAGGAGCRRGAAWDGWPAEPRQYTGSPPGALRIGEVRPPRHRRCRRWCRCSTAGTSSRRPATTGDARRRAWSPRCCCARSADPRPGAVRLTGYDPERLGGGLAGFAPLAAGRAAHLRRAGRPGRAARRAGRAHPPDQRDRAGRRVRRRCATLAAAHRPAARSRGGWRCCSAPASADELTRHERAQLDRIVRTGVACGVHLVVRGLDLPDAPDGAADHRRRPGRHASRRYPALPVRLDPPPPAELVTASCRAIAERVRAGPPPGVVRRPAAREAVDASRRRTGWPRPIGDGTDGRRSQVHARRLPAARADRRARPAPARPT